VPEGVPRNLRTIPKGRRLLICIPHHLRQSKTENPKDPALCFSLLVRVQ